MSIDKQTVRRVAHLARIEVPEDDLDALAGELSNILGFMEQLNEVNVDGVEPLTSISSMTLPYGDDMVNDGNQVEEVLKNAPVTREGFFVVPKVVE